MKKIAITIVVMITVFSAYSNHNTFNEVIKTAIILTDTFKKIDAKELPLAVVEALLKEYPTSKLSQAFKNHQDKYKLIMVLKSGTRRTIYIDAYGRWLKKAQAL